MKISRISDVFAARKIWDLLTSDQRRSAIGLLALMLIGTVLETLGIGLVVPAIAVFTKPDFLRGFPWLRPVLEALGNPGHSAIVIGTMTALVGVYLFKALFLALVSWRQMRFAFGIQAEMSQRLFTVYLHQPYVFHLQRNSAELIRNTINEVNLFIFYVVIAGLTLLTEALVIPAISILLLIVEPVGALVVISVLAVAAWVFHHFTRGYVTRWGEMRQHHDGLRLQHLQQGLGGAKDVKLLGRESEFLSQYSIHNHHSARMNELQLFLMQLPRLGLELLAVAGLVLLVFTMMKQGRELEAILPTLGLFAAAAFRLMPSVNRILGAMHSLRFAGAVIHTLHKELKLAIPEIEKPYEPAAPLRETLALEQVAFTYPGAPAPALKNLSLVIRAGESVGIVGASGAGKSTLVDVLLGLLTPDSGAVNLDGHDVQKFLRGWQDQIGYVPQTIYLTDDSLCRNVAFGLGDDHIDKDAVWRAIRAAQLEGFVKDLPQGLETVVGERGVKLSGGQRQRIGIARALYHDPGVLVLDEATSSLDTDTEREVMQAVRTLQGKTILIVAHRFSTVEHCDRIYRLEKGELVGTGTPQTMLLSAAGA